MMRQHKSVTRPRVPQYSIEDLTNVMLAESALTTAVNAAVAAGAQPGDGSPEDREACRAQVSLNAARAAAYRNAHRLA